MNQRVFQTFTFSIQAYQIFIVTGHPPGPRPPGSGSRDSGGYGG